MSMQEASVASVLRAGAAQRRFAGNIVDYIEESVMTLVVDIETNLTHTHIWCAVSKELETGEVVRHTSAATLQPLLDNASTVIGHNFVAFDAVHLRQYWGCVIPAEKIADTLLISRVFDVNRAGGHSLKVWGEALAAPKDDYAVEEHDDPLDERKWLYCEQDVVTTGKLYRHLMKELTSWRYDLSFIELESRVAEVTAQQEKNGFLLDVVKASSLYAALSSRRREIEEELQREFPPLVHERWSEKTGKRLKDRVEVFNVGSRQQIARRLASIGVVWKKKTPKTDKGGGGNLIIDEGTLKPLVARYPQAGMVLEYLTLGKKSSMIDGWLRHVGEDGRVHGRVNSCGAVTGRMTHSAPNVAQADSDKDTRSCWIVDEGSVLVGVDASGLELRCLAHYMNDPEYTALILDGDIHTYNMKAAGLTERGQAKTFIYAFLYGAGDAKIGSIVGGGAAAGKKLKQDFLEAIPSLRQLKDKIVRIAAGGSIPAIDGRRLRIRSDHAALNTLLQGCGAMVMKKALVLGDAELRRLRIPYRFVANVHDEWQIEVPDAYGKAVGKIMVKAIVDAGRYYNMRCPMDGEYKIGVNWSETH